MKCYKILVNGESCNGGKAKWFLPKGKQGKWMPKIEGELELCVRGYHIVKAEDILRWTKENCEIYEVEPKGKVTYDDSKGVCRTVRLVRRLKWDDKIARSFACDCAERVLPIYEKLFPDEKRPRVAVETARKFIFGLATKEEMAAARDAAWAAARAATRAAARDAARDAAGDAAWDVAGDAARDAAGDAAWDAARAATRAAARDAARDAAWAAARDVAGDAAEAAEKKWQTKRLLSYLNGKIVPSMKKVGK